MIPDPDEYDSDEQWAIAATERYISTFATEHGVEDPEMIASAEITDRLFETNIALLDRLRSVDDEGAEPSSATNRMPGVVRSERSDARSDSATPFESSAPAERSTSDERSESANQNTPFGSSPDGVTHHEESGGPDQATDDPSSGQATTAEHSRSGDETASERTDERGVPVIMSSSTQLLYFTLALLAFLSPIVYYAQTTTALVDLPVAQGTPITVIPFALLFAVIVGSLGVFLLSAPLFVIARYGIVNPPEPETIRERHTMLRLLAHLAAFSGFVLVFAAAAFVIITGLWPTAYAVDVLPILLG